MLAWLKAFCIPLFSGLGGLALFHAKDQRHVLVLLATRNGLSHLDAQMSSLLTQSVPRLDIRASDDASTDGTVARLEDWRSQWSKGTYEIVAGPDLGFAENFRSLILAAPPADYVAFCDQDDIWDSDKLEIAMTTLESRSHGRPALYCSRSRLVDKSGRSIGQSLLFGRPPSFRNALVQSLAGGNTMVFNRAGFELLQTSARRTRFLMHDWWSYLILTGAGGEVYYDRVPHLSYRQHESNAIGGRVTLLQRPGRLLDLVSGKFAALTDRNMTSLARCSDLLTADAAHAIEEFETIRRSPPVSALRRLARSGLYRQTRKGHAALYLAAALNKL